MMTKNQIIGSAFEQHYNALLNYVSVRIQDRYEAEDIVQDVFVRLMGYDVITEETVRSLCFTVANNIVVDHIRRYYKTQEVYSYIYDMMENRLTLTPEQLAVYEDLVEKERCAMAKLSPATARVYEMSQIKGMSIEEISDELSISKRTVECHQFKARKFVREEIRKVI